MGLKGFTQMYRYACMFINYRLSLRIPLVSLLSVTYLLLLLFKKVREGPLFEGEGVGSACKILRSKGRSLIGACALIIRENTVTFQSETL